ncbi:MAG TPA: hypothetical protein VEL47_05060 [Myxococcota bacterium]|nr:hypothetical protein [Myxococcota bacterium]
MKYLRVRPVVVALALITAGFSVTLAASDQGVPYRWTVSPLCGVEAARFETALGIFVRASSVDALLGMTLLFPLLDLVGEMKARITKAGQVTYRMYTEAAASDYAERLDRIEFYLYPWASAVREEIDSEMAQLAFAISHHVGHVQSNGVMQLHAIKTQLVPCLSNIENVNVSMEEPVKGFERAIDLLALIQDHLDELSQHLREVIKRIGPLLGQRQPLEHVVYGSDAYFALDATRPPLPKSFFGRQWERLERYLNPLGYIPEIWRPTPRQVGIFFAALLVVGQHLAKAVDRALPSDRLVDPRAKAAPSDATRQIDREVAFIGTMLTDKHSMLRDEQALDRWAAHYPEALPTLKAALSQFGSNALSPEAIRHIMDSHRAQRTAK